MIQRLQRHRGVVFWSREHPHAREGRTPSNERGEYDVGRPRLVACTSRQDLAALTTSEYPHTNQPNTNPHGGANGYGMIARAPSGLTWELWEYVDYVRNT